MRQMSVKLIDSLPQLGGQIAALYPEKRIYDVAGFPSITAKELTARLVEQASFAKPTVCLNEQVERLETATGGDGYVLRTDRESHWARTVIIAAGIGSFTPKRLPAEHGSFEGRGLFYSVADPEFFRHKRVLIVGGGDSAVDWANTLADIAEDTALVHRRDVFRAHEANVDLLRRSRVKLHLFHEVKALIGDASVQGAVIEDVRTGQQTTLPVDAIIANLGYESSLGPLKHWGLALKGGSIQVGPTMQTSRPGIFAIGDVCTYEGKLKLIATGFGEAATAINFAKKHIDPSANPFPGHSTSVAPLRMPGIDS